MSTQGTQFDAGYHLMSKERKQFDRGYHLVLGVSTQLAGGYHLLSTAGARSSKLNISSCFTSIIFQDFIFRS